MEVSYGSHCDGVLDFVLMAGSARSWTGEAKVLFDNVIPKNDDDKHSNHVPVMATFEMSESRS